MGWSEDLRLGIHTLDEQHQSLFECLTRLKGFAAIGDKGLATRVAVVELGDYINIHFFMEEALMRSESYPLLDSHIIEHEIITEKVRQLRDRSEYDDAFDETLIFLSDWLVNHIGSSDRHFAQFRKSQGK